MPAPDLNRLVLLCDPALADLLRSVRSALDGDVWVVGGFPRDLLLGRRPLDLDLAVPADSRGAARRLAAALGGSAFQLHEERDTSRVTLREGPLATIDVIRLRAPDIEGDLRERDFTINAIGAALTSAGLGPTLDPTGGEGDLRARLIRMTSEQALVDDPLRMLRAVRLAVELDFEVEPATAGAIRALAPAILETATERQRDELMRIMASPYAARGARLLDGLSLLDTLLPELAAARGVSQPKEYHYYDVLDHCIEALAVSDWLLSEREPPTGMPRDLRRAFDATFGPFGTKDYFAGGENLSLTKFATLLHDVAKPQTRTVEAGGRVRFLGHSEAGADVAREVCRRLRFGGADTAFVALLIEEHLRPAQLSQSGLPTDRAIFRFFRALGDAAVACLVLSLADAAASLGPTLTLSRWQAHLSYIAYVLERGLRQREVLGGRHFVSGDTLIRELGIPPGPKVGRLLAALDEAAAAGEVRTEEEAIQLARRLHAPLPRSSAQGPDA